MPIISEKQNNQKQVLTLNELEKRKVVEHNSLITSISKMDKTPLKMFELAVSCIDTEKPLEDNTVYLSKKDLFAFFKVSDNDKHSRFKEAVEKMQKQAFFKIKEKKDKGFEFENIVPIPYVKWTDYNDEVLIRFSPEIIPYLVNLKKNFTQHALSDLAELNSKYSIILYRWLSMNYNQYEHYSVKGGRRAEQVEAYRNPSISIKELREMTDTINEYKLMHQFTERILKEPLEDELVLQAINSPYTKLLMEHFLLSYLDLMDIKILAGLQKNVYPLYDELKDLRGLNGVKDHLSYVGAKQEDYSKKNICKYLKKAIEQYLPTVKRQDL